MACGLARDIPKWSWKILVISGEEVNLGKGRCEAFKAFGYTNFRYKLLSHTYLSLVDPLVSISHEVALPLAPKVSPSQLAVTICHLIDEWKLMRVQLQV